jgi:hypothetical protein
VQRRRRRKSIFSARCSLRTAGGRLRSITIGNCRISETRFISVESRLIGQISETYRDRSLHYSGDRCVFAASLRRVSLIRITQWSTVNAKWYLGVRCHKCGSPILFALDRSGAESGPAPARRLVLTCAPAGCRHQTDCTTPPVARFHSSRPRQTRAKAYDEGREGWNHKHRIESVV